MILNDIVKATQKRVADLKRKTDFADLRERAHPPQNPFAFEKALGEEGISFICEVKKASPSKGVIAEDFPYIQIATDYEAAGASAISVLTEPTFFQGSNDYLKEIRQVVRIPILRKDFVIDPIQLVEAAILGADAVLLIVSILQPRQIEDNIRLADELGLSTLVEAHDEGEVEIALKAGARVIGVNNRNLKNFEVDIQNSIRLRKLVPDDIRFVSESGIKTPRDIEALRKNGTDAVLIGETLMRCADKKAELEKFRGV